MSFFYLHGLGTLCNFIQRPEQVLIELDISAIEDYIVFIIIIFMINSDLITNTYMFLCLFYQHCCYDH